MKTLFLVACTLIPSTLSAAFIFDGNPGNFSGDSNLLYNDPGLLTSGNTVQGNAQGFVIDIFATPLELLNTPAGGQARVEANDGGISTLTYVPSLAGVTFKTFIINVNAIGAGDVEVSFVAGAGSSVANGSQGFALSGGGQNFIRLEATNGDTIRSVSLSITGTSASDVRQVRAGDWRALLLLCPNRLPWPLSASAASRSAGGAVRAARFPPAG